MGFEDNCVENVCRICLDECKKLYPLHGPIPNVDEDIANMIKYCTSVEVKIADDLPKGVCIPCFRIIRISYNFIRQFTESNKKLLENREKHPNEWLCKQEQESVEYTEEIIIEYSKENFDKNALLNTIKLAVVEGNHEELKQELYIQEEVDFSEDRKNYDTVKISPTLAEHQSDEEDKNTSVTEPDQNEFTEGASETNLLSQRKDTQRFTCPICRKSFKKFEQEFVKHLSIHEDVKVNCDRCSLETSLSMDLYIQHFRKAHKFQCNICGKSYGRRSGIYYHMKTHNDRKIFNCSYESCGKSFLTGWCLRKHLHTHSESVKYVCSKCGSEFKSYGTYKYHQKTHDGNRSYLCTECGQTFLQSIHLKYHMWKHTGIKMFKCDKCHKSYTSQTQLKKHKTGKYCGVLPKMKKVKNEQL